MLSPAPMAKISSLWIAFQGMLQKPYVINHPNSPCVSSLREPGPIPFLRAILQYFIRGFQELQPSWVQGALKMQENRPNLGVPDRAAQRLSKTLEGNFPVGAITDQYVITARMREGAQDWTYG